MDLGLDGEVDESKKKPYSAREDITAMIAKADKYPTPRPQGGVAPFNIACGVWWCKRSGLGQVEVCIAYKPQVIINYALCKNGKTPQLWQRLEMKMG